LTSLQGSLFGTNGIRFIPGVTHDLDFAIKIGESIGTYFSEGEILVGRDGRLSSPALSSAITAGLMSSGRDVAEAGVVPTPALQYAVKTMGYRGGVMITASHNPPEYNGVKVFGRDGVEISRLDEQKIEKIFRENLETKANWKDVGVARNEQSVIKEYIRGILSKINARLISEKRFSIVMDPGNGAQCLASPYLLDSLSCKLITINCIIDGGFPGRGPEPTPETLQDLSLAVKAVGADLGIAYDGDGDRAIFCDENGNVYWGDQLGSLLADYLLEKNPGVTIVTPISSSQVVETIAKRRDARVIRTRVGSIDVSRTIIERKAFLGFEENGGFIYPVHMTVRDGGMTTALMLECLAARDMPLSRAMSHSVPKFYQAKTKLPIAPEKVKQVMKLIERQANGQTERVDGIKIWADKQSWVLVRPSGTEPLIRIFSESITQDKADSILKKFVKIVKSAQAK
jgi:phosphomannomutase/phosphoglucomutase